MLASRANAREAISDHSGPSQSAGFNVSCNSMLTPAQLRDRLHELGISCELRTLTDWREKGLLPPLRSVGAGRGRGVRRYWSDVVLEQVMAAEWFIRDTGRADDALIGLWFSGFSVDHVAAQQAWVQAIERIQHQREKQASRFSGTYVGLAGSWLRKMRRKGLLDPLPQGPSQGSVTLMGELFQFTQEWLRDEVERDDEAYRDLVADVLVRLTGADGVSVHLWVDEIWAAIEPVSVFSITAYTGFVRSLSVQEMRVAQESLIQVVHMLQQTFQLFGVVDDRLRLVMTLRLMRDFFGPLVARTVILCHRNAPELPIRETISAIHTFVLSVQSIDINKKEDGALLVSERVRTEWKETKQKLTALWWSALA